MEKEKIVSIEDRIPKLKQMRKKKANRKLLFYLSVFFILIMIIVYLESPLSNVSKISIKGNEMIAEEEILELSGITSDVNFWAINKGLIEKEILHHPLIKSVDVSRTFPQSITIEVEEDRIIGFKSEDTSYVPLLSNGESITDEHQLNGARAPLLNGFTEESYLQRMATELSDVPVHIFDLISEVTWAPTDKNKYKIILFMNDGFTVHATIRSFAEKMEAYPSIVSQLDPNDNGIIHMGVGTYYEPSSNVKEENAADEADGETEATESE